MNEVRLHSLRAVHPVPDVREDVPNDTSHNCSDDDNRDSRGEIKRFDGSRRVDHMRPETEVDEPLRPVQRDEDRPNEMQSTHERAKGKSGLGWVNMLVHNDAVIWLIPS